MKIQDILNRLLVYIEFNTDTDSFDVTFDVEGNYFEPLNGSLKNMFLIMKHVINEIKKHRRIQGCTTKYSFDALAEVDYEKEDFVNFKNQTISFADGGGYACFAYLENSGKYYGSLNNEPDFEHDNIYDLLVWNHHSDYRIIKSNKDLRKCVRKCNTGRLSLYTRALTQNKINHTIDGLYVEFTL